MNQIQTIRTPTGPLALVLTTAKKLLAEGVISGTLDGDLHAADAATVKAGIMAHAVCDFCGVPGATHCFDVPDFSMGAVEGVSVGAWASCDLCADLIRANKRQALVTRTMQNLAFPKFSRRAIEELLGKFWQGMDDKACAEITAAAIGDYIDDRFPPDLGKAVLTDRGLRIAGVMKMTGLTRSEVDEVLAGTPNQRLVAKMVAFEKQYGKLDGRTFDRLSEPHKPLADLVPHWQRALDVKFTALTQLSALVHRADRLEYFKEATDLNDPKAVAALTQMAKTRASMRDLGLDEDVKYLRAAQAYSFNSETAAAIREASQSVPHDAPLSSIETPNTGAGWFWFADPLHVVASPASPVTSALLWGWTDGTNIFQKLRFTSDMLEQMTPEDREEIVEIGNKKKKGFSDRQRVSEIANRTNFTQEEKHQMRLDGTLEPALMFSVYVMDEGMPIPSTKWYWPLSMSFHDMLAYNTIKYRQSYGPGGPFENAADSLSEQTTLACIAELSLFFIMACLWFKQTVPVLERTPGHVERHARKRYAKEHKLDGPPTVHVVALRRSLRVPSDEKPSDATTARNYQCRWIVRGHPRLQPCGPGRKDTKLLWIEAHPAGPDDKPLRVRDTVYAVIR